MVFFDSKLINLAHPKIVALNPLTLLRYLLLLWFSAIGFIVIASWTVWQKLSDFLFL